jgi:hypothetical protein
MIPSAYVTCGSLHHYRSKPSVFFDAPSNGLHVPDARILRMNDQVIYIRIFFHSVFHNYSIAFRRRMRSVWRSRSVNPPHTPKWTLFVIAYSKQTTWLEQTAHSFLPIAGAPLEGKNQPTGAFLHAESNTSSLGSFGSGLQSSFHAPTRLASMIPAE